MSYILIIDDDADGAAATAAVLRREGMAAVCVHSAAAALGHLRQNPPALVLLDIAMPEVSGLEMLEALGADPRFDDLRIAAFSGSTDPAVRAKALNLGACDFIAKGADWREISARIRKHYEEACAGS